MTAPHLRPRRGPIPRLHVLTDARPGRHALRVTEAALAAGAPCVQVRSKDRHDRAHLAFAAAVVERCRAHGAVCLVNDRVDIALASGADGVHLGADDLPVAAVRDLAGERLLVGGTAREPGTARALVAAGADYLGVGPVFTTATKTGLPEPIGLDMISAVAHSVEVPVIGIAGITAARVGAVLGAGAHGVAVVGAVADAEDAGVATRALLARIDAALTPSPGTTDGHDVTATAGRSATATVGPDAAATDGRSATGGRA